MMGQYLPQGDQLLQALADPDGDAYDERGWWLYVPSRVWRETEGYTEPQRLGYGFRKALKRAAQRGQYRQTLSLFTEGVK